MSFCGFSFGGNRSLVSTTPRAFTGSDSLDSQGEGSSSDAGWSTTDSQVWSYSGSSCCAGEVEAEEEEEEEPYCNIPNHMNLGARIDQLHVTIGQERQFTRQLQRQIEELRAETTRANDLKQQLRQEQERTRQLRTQVQRLDQRLAAATANATAVHDNHGERLGSLRNELQAARSHGRDMERRLERATDQRDGAAHDLVLAQPRLVDLALATALLARQRRPPLPARSRPAPPLPTEPAAARAASRRRSRRARQALPSKEVAGLRAALGKMAEDVAVLPRGRGRYQLRSRR